MKNAINDQFIGTSRHQLLTPLNAILGFSELLLLKIAGDLTPEQEQQIQIINNSGKNLLALINSLSTLAKITTGEVVVDIEEFDLGELIYDLLISFEPLVETKDIELIKPQIKSKINIQSDKQVLDDIISNLLSNAIKFTPKGKISLKIEEEKNNIVIHVIDTGVGIKADKLGWIFQPYQQLKIGENKSEGCGLGLHISKKLADLIAATINVSSEFGQGTHFTLSIPRKYKQ